MRKKMTIQIETDELDEPAREFEQALEEILRLVKIGFHHGFAGNETSEFSFETETINN